MALRIADLVIGRFVLLMIANVVHGFEECCSNSLNGLEGYCPTSTECKECVISKATTQTDYNKNNNLTAGNFSLNRWIEFCYFPAPKDLVQNHASYNCNTQLPAGPVSCYPITTTVIQLKNFTSTCSLVIILVNYTGENRFFVPQLDVEPHLEKDGPCKDQFNKICMDHANSQLSYVETRLESGETFGNIRLWKRTCPPQTDSSAIIMITIISVIITLILAGLCVRHILKKVQTAIPSIENDELFCGLNEMLQEPPSQMFEEIE